jgi:hypothetical protein
MVVPACCPGGPPFRPLHRQEESFWIRAAWYAAHSCPLLTTDSTKVRTAGAAGDAQVVSNYRDATSLSGMAADRSFGRAVSGFAGCGRPFNPLGGSHPANIFPWPPAGSPSVRSSSPGPRPCCASANHGHLSQPIHAQLPLTGLKRAGQHEHRNRCDSRWLFPAPRGSADAPPAATPRCPWPRGQVRLTRLAQCEAVTPPMTSRELRAHISADPAINCTVVSSCSSSMLARTSATRGVEVWGAVRRRISVSGTRSPTGRPASITVSPSIVHLMVFLDQP